MSTKKSRQWALRCGMEARVNVGMMITLTYDTYKNGVDGEENPVDTSLRVQKPMRNDLSSVYASTFQTKL